MLMGMSSARNRFVKKRRISPTIVLPMSVRMSSLFSLLRLVPSGVGYHLNQPRKGQSPLRTRAFLVHQASDTTSSGNLASGVRILGSSLRVDLLRWIYFCITDSIG